MKDFFEKNEEKNEEIAQNAVWKAKYKIASKKLNLSENEYKTIGDAVVHNIGCTIRIDKNNKYINTMRLNKEINESLDSFYDRVDTVIMKMSFEGYRGIPSKLIYLKPIEDDLKGLVDISNTITALLDRETAPPVIGDTVSVQAIKKQNSEKIYFKI